MKAIKPFCRNAVLQCRSWFRYTPVIAKKIVRSAFVIGLLVIYSISAIGITVHFHYCMGRFAGWSLVDQKDKKCSKCGMLEHKKGCCSDVHKHIKLSEDHQKISFTLKPVLLDQGYSIPIVFEERPFDLAMVFPVWIWPDPPLLNRPRLHLQHCVFLI